MVAEENWTTLDGWAAAKGVDPMSLTMDRFLNLTYFFATEGADPDDLRKFDSQLNRPDASRLRKSTENTAWSKENEEASLSAFAAAFGGAKR